MHILSVLLGVESSCLAPVVRAALLIRYELLGVQLCSELVALRLNVLALHLGHTGLATGPVNR